MSSRVLGWFKKFFSEDKSPSYSLRELNRIKILEERLGYNIESPLYYIKALTHRSYLEINNELEKSNERLEFLGDSVLGLIVAEKLFRKFSNKDEGFLTKYRSQLVDRDALVAAANRINLEDLVLYDERYIRDSEEGKNTIMADCAEALLGAIYLDLGMNEARKFVDKWFLEPGFESGEFKKDKNYKGQLLELTHSKKLQQPQYRILKEDGPDHAKEFLIEVMIGNESFGKGIGSSKKSAEQEAAKEALRKIFHQTA